MFLDMCIVFFFFFFSSRRRHTRLTCDWSSDVCSSDLRVSRADWRAVSSSENRVGSAPPQWRLEGRYNAVLMARRSEEHTSELQSHVNLVCRLLLEKKKKRINTISGEAAESVGDYGT